MKRRKLPHLTPRLTAILATALLAACVALGLATRASLTDFNNDSDALDSLPYVIDSQRSETLSYDANKEALDSAEVVLVATCRGRGTYVYQSFLRELEVVEVLRGSGEQAGDLIYTYDNLAIEEPRNYSGKGQFSAQREVVQMGLGPNARGAAPLRDGQTYLIFLARKEGLSSTDEPRYIQVHSVYAHVALDGPGHPERVRIRGSAQNGDIETIPFCQAREFDAFVCDEDCRGLYLDTSRQILNCFGIAG